MIIYIYGCEYSRSSFFSLSFSLVFFLLTIYCSDYIHRKRNTPSMCFTSTKHNTLFSFFLLFTVEFTSSSSIFNCVAMYVYIYIYIHICIYTQHNTHHRYDFVHRTDYRLINYPTHLFIYLV